MKDQVRLLKRLGAPQKLIDSFVEVCEINSKLPDGDKESFTKLLDEQCRLFGFHDILPEGWFFRPYSLSGASCRNDTAVRGGEPDAPAIEQAYRRGTAQGFALCRRMVRTTLPEIEEMEKEIDQWRRRTVQRFGSAPGDKEKPPRKLFGGRNAVSDRMRWLVFKRDENRCVVCGQTASSIVRLEVDHIVPVAKGGFDTIENLQTLCNRCNSGKSDT
ncbi:MAG: HNH endonuclease signature motif containing protein [Hyphomicrobiaceae bacterium]